MKTAVSVGRCMENLAALIVAMHGFRILSRNFTTAVGEIDIIGAHEDLLVFIEVRYRRQSQFGSGLDSVDIHKQKRIIDTAERFLARHPSYAHHRYRFDVVSISRPNYFPRLQWIRNAFSHDDVSTAGYFHSAAAAHSLRVFQ